VLNEEWFTGFFEGDGSVGVTTQYFPARQVKIQFAQRDISLVQYILANTLGGITCVTKPGYNFLAFNGRNCIPLLTVLRQCVVTQATLERLNVALDALGQAGTDILHSISWDWFAGF